MGIRDILFPWRLIKDLKNQLDEKNKEVDFLKKELIKRDNIIKIVYPTYEMDKLRSNNLEIVEKIKEETIAHLNEDLSSHEGKYTQEFLEAKMAEAGLGNYPKYHFNPQLEAEPEKYDF